MRMGVPQVHYKFIQPIFNPRRSVYSANGVCRTEVQSWEVIARDSQKVTMTEAQHTEAYLWRHIFGLCAELRARRIVDIGCGNGALCHELATHGYEVVGCEPCSEILHLAQRGTPGLVFHALGVDDDPV